MGTTALRCDGLTKRFAGGTALDGLTLDAGVGEVVALLGPNGAGKTTTIRLLNGVLLADAGGASVLGLDPWRQGTELRRRTGVLTENAGLDERFTALENLVSTAELRGIDRREGRRRGGELLERFGMGHRADAKVQGFSTGQRKRVALARSLLHDPELLYLDEPTSGLDPAATRDVVEMIASLASERGRTVILCTHFLGEAGKLASRMAVLFQGRMHAFGTPDALAAELWSDTEVEILLAAPPPATLIASLATIEPVVQAVPTRNGLIVRVRSVDATPVIVRTCVAAGVDVHSVTPRSPTLEDVYFAIEARAQEAGADDGLGARPVAS